MDRYCQAELAAVHKVLRETLRGAGSGTIHRTEEGLGLYRGYIRYHRHRRELDLGVLFAILKRLDVQPAEFFDQVAAEIGADTGGEDPEPEPEPDPEPEPEPEADPEDPPPGAPPDDAPLTARKVLRDLGADLPVL